MSGTSSDTALGLACAAVRAVERARPRAGEHVAVIGRGPLADVVTAALADAGVRDVRRSDGAPGEQPSDLAFETTGDPAVVNAVLDAAPRLGRVVLLGPSHKRTADVDFYRTVHQKSLVLIGVACPADPEVAPEVSAARRLVAGARETT